MTLSEKRIVYSNASGRGLVRYEEKDVKEFIKLLKEEVNEEHLLIKEIHKIIDKLVGPTLNGI